MYNNIHVKPIILLTNLQFCRSAQRIWKNTSVNNEKATYTLSSRYDDYKYLETVNSDSFNTKINMYLFVIVCIHTHNYMLTKLKYI